MDLWKPMEAIVLRVQSEKHSLAWCLEQCYEGCEYMTGYWWVGRLTCFFECMVSILEHTNIIHSSIFHDSPPKQNASFFKTMNVRQSSSSQPHHAMMHKRHAMLNTAQPHSHTTQWWTKGTQCWTQLILTATPRNDEQKARNDDCKAAHPHSHTTQWWL